jgi:hypothetical protein
MQQIASTSRRRRRVNSGIRPSSRAGQASPAPATADVIRDSHHRDLGALVVAEALPGTKIQPIEIHWRKDLHACLKAIAKCRTHFLRFLA